MKMRLLSLVLIMALVGSVMSGCQMAEKVEAAGRTVERGVEYVGDRIMQVVDPTRETAPGQTPTPALSLEEAQDIALKHAGFTADQVTQLHTEYEIENGIPQYEVEFRHGRWEYDYEIHGNTGNILSYSKDD